jgi:hypothetical protein
MTVDLTKCSQAQNHSLKASRHLDPYQGLLQFGIGINGGL